jgi:hypothetical protein
MQQGIPRDGTKDRDWEADCGPSKTVMIAQSGSLRLRKNVSLNVGLFFP